MPDIPLDTYLNPPTKPRRGNYDEIINRHASRTGLDADLVRAVMGQESGGNPAAVSPKGARGPMQLMPATARRFGVTDPHDPEQAIRGGTDYLKFLNDRFKGNRDLVLAGYNAGEGAVDKFHGVPPYRETQNYVKSINARLGQRPQKPTSDLDAYLDPSPGQTPPQQTELKNSTIPVTPRDPATLPANQSVPLSIEQVLDDVARSTTRATERIKRQAARQVGRQPQQPPSSGVGELRRLDDPETSRIITTQQSEQERNPLLTKFRGGQLTSAQAQRAASQATQQRAADLQHQRDEPEIEQLTAAYRADIRQQGLPQWLTETLSRGGAGIGEFGVGVGKLFAPLTRDPDAARARLDTLRKHADAMTRAAVAEGADRNVVSRTIQDATAGFLASIPELAAMTVGAPPVVTFGAGSGVRAYGRGEGVEGVAKVTAHGLATGAALEAPIPGRLQGRLARAATKGATVGSATTAIDLASGATPQQAIASGLTNAAFAGHGELHRPVEVRNAAVKESFKLPLIDPRELSGRLKNQLSKPYEITYESESGKELTRTTTIEKQMRQLGKKQDVVNRLIDCLHG